MAQSEHCPQRRRWITLLGWCLLLLPLLVLVNLFATGVKGQPQFLPGAASNDPYPMPPELAGVDLLQQTAEVAAAKSAGCVACHQNTCDPHARDTLHLGCCDCHGGAKGKGRRARIIRAAENSH